MSVLCTLRPVMPDTITSGSFRLSTCCWPQAHTATRSVLPQVSSTRNRDTIVMISLFFFISVW